MGARRKDREQGIYRRVTVRMWGDAKVMALSRPQPCGQVLWIHLLTGEQTDIIPGLCKIGEAAFAEQIGWSLEGFREAFTQVSRLGLAKADWNARVVWVPKSIKHNPPASANVVASWADAWDRIPECALKLEAWSTLKAFLEGLHEGFQKAFAKACPKPSVMPSGNQEQEQEQIKNSLSSASAPEFESQTSVLEAVDVATPLAAEAVSGTDPRAAPSTTETTHEPEPGKPAAPETHAGAGETATTTATSGGPPLAVAAAFTEDNSAGLSPRELGALHRMGLELPEERYPLTAQVMAALHVRGRESAWGKPPARSSAEAAIRLAGGVDAAVARLMAIPDDEFAIHPQLTWWSGVIAGKAGAHVSSGPRRGPRADAWEPAPAPTPTTEPHPLEDLIHDA